MNSKILVIYTGGTIGMVKSEAGTYVPFDVDSLLENVPQINSLGIELSVESFDEPLDSAFVGPSEWLNISNRIASNYESYDAFVILHGTDTMAYTSSALSFLLEGIDKPVILSGSQIPICEEGTDGVDNFMNALKVAKEGLVNRIAVWFHKSLYNGASVTKVDSKGFNGFDSPNKSVLAELGSEIKYNKNGFINEKPALQFYDKAHANVYVLTVSPILNKEAIAEFIKANSFDGIVLSVLGSGTIPIVENDVLFKTLKEARIPIIAVSECLKGGVEIGKYEAGSVLNKLEVISGEGMTKEAAIAKMTIGTANYAELKEVKAYLRQEISNEF